MQADPYKQYDTYQLVDGNKTKPVVPEPSTYGAIFILLMLAIILYRKTKRRLKTS